MFANSFRPLAAALAGVAVLGLVATPAAIAAPIHTSKSIVTGAGQPGLVAQVDWRPHRHYYPRRHHGYGGQAAVAAAALGIVGLAIANASRPSNECDYGGCYAPQSYYPPQTYYAPQSYVYSDDTYYAPQPEYNYAPAPVYASAPVYAPAYRPHHNWNAQPYAGGARNWQGAPGGHHNGGYAHVWIPPAAEKAQSHK